MGHRMLHGGMQNVSMKPHPYIFKGYRNGWRKRISPHLKVTFNLQKCSRRTFSKKLFLHLSRTPREKHTCDALSWLHRCGLFVSWSVDKDPRLRYEGGYSPLFALSNKSFFLFMPGVKPHVYIFPQWLSVCSACRVSVYWCPDVSPTIL